MNQVRWAAYAILVARELLFGRYDKRACAALALFAGMGAIAWHANSLAYVDVLAFAFAARDLRFRVIARFVFAELLVLTATVFFCAGAGIIPNVLFEAYQSRPERYALGFSHPNGAASYMFFLTIIWAYLRGKRYGAIDAGVSLAVMLAIFALTNCRTVLFAFLLFAMLYFALRFGPDKLRSAAFLKTAGPCAFIVIAGLGIALCVGYDPACGWMQGLDSLLSGRLSLGHSAIEEHGVPLLGQAVSLGRGAHYDFATQVWVEGTVAPIVDSAYIQMLIRFGPLFFLAAMGLVIHAMRYTAGQSEWLIVAIAIALAAYALMETAPAGLTRDVFLLLLAAPFGMRARTPSSVFV